MKTSTEKRLDDLESAFHDMNISLTTAADCGKTIVGIRDIAALSRILGVMIRLMRDIRKECLEARRQ